MACMLNSDPRRLYSWWWDSHISPKNSKWLQENLTDMDAKVKSMIKLIEEDADSFARRAEMYYKKRPELMKLVEEFYRAYRALAERYDYATGELRHAQRTLQAAFPNQEHLGPAEDSSSSITTSDFSRQLLALLDPDDLQKKFLEGNIQNIDENDEIKAKIFIESERADKAECEIKNLKTVLADILSEKESLLVKYQESLEKFSSADGELNCALESSKKLDEKASEAEKEVRLLKEALSLMQVEKEAGLTKQMEYLETISDLEEKISHAQEETKGMGQRAVEAETEARHLMNKLAILESENDAGLLNYGKCLDRISVLEKKILEMEDEAKMFSEQAARAQEEVDKLRKDLSQLYEEKEALRVLYAECLEKSYNLELDLSSAQKDVQRLNAEIIARTKSLKNAEEICVRLEMSNQFLKLEASDLAKKIMLKDEELCEKHEDLEKLRSCAKNEHTHYVQVEAALQTLQTLYTRSQEEQRALALELKNGLQMVKDLEICKSGLEEEMKQVKDDNKSLNELNASSAVSVKNSEVEILGLKQMKERLEDEVALQLGQCSAMQQEICGLKEEITELNTSHQALMSQLESAGLNPESFGSSIKDVKELLEKNTALESSLLDVNCELEGSRNKVEELQSSCELLHGEKTALFLEKTLLLSQLHIITVNMQKLMDQSVVLENSLSSANVELEHLREKSKGLEELSEFLNDEKSNLVAERSMLASQLESVQKRLETLEKRFIQFEERYGGLEKEKEMGNSQIQELMCSLSMEKQERESFMTKNQERLDDLENNIQRLHEDNKWRKEEFQEELDKAVIAQFENFILHKFIQDVEEKNYSLLVEREKHVEASKLADNLISELETEILEQQVEKEAGLTKQMEYLETISDLEEKISHAQEETKGMGQRAVEAETEARHLMNKLAILESENDAGLLNYGKCLDRISVLEKKILEMEDEAKMFSEQAARAQEEVDKLRKDLSQLYEEKEALRVLYAECLEKSYNLELDLSSAQKDVQRLNAEIIARTKSLKNAEEICVRLEMSNQFLKLEASDLAKKIMLKDEELCEKHEDLEKLRSCAKNEHTHYVQVEAALQTLQTLYTRSQEEQRALALELKNGLQMVKDLEICKSGLEEEMKQVKDDNKSLNELNASSAVSVKNSEVEILGLKQMKERLEDEVALQLGQCSAMQQEICGLKEEITELNTSHQALMSQLESAGLNPESFGSSIKDVKELLEKNTALESSLLDVNCELEGSRNKVEELQSSCELLHGEKTALFLEKTLLLSQLHIITVNMQKLMDQSVVLENSLSSANVELEHLREKSKGLEELSEFLNDEKSNLVAERSMLASQLESVQKRLETLEKRFIQFEERYGGLEKEKEMGNSQIQELMCSLSMEKQERESFMTKNQERLDDLENNIQRLHEDNKWRKEEFQEELDKAVIAQFENFILHKFIQDVEEKNYSLLVEREKHVEASKLADNLISELETEILEQQVEEELLLVEVENLRLGIYQVFMALEIGSKGGFKDGYETSKISVEEIISNIKDIKCALLKEEEEKQRLLVENKIVITLLQQLKSEFQESELHKTSLINKYEIMKDDFKKANKEKLELTEVNRQLIVEVNNGENKAKILKSEVEGLHARNDELQHACIDLQDEYAQELDENRALKKDFLNLKEENDCLVLESLALGNISTIFSSFSAEKAAELRLLSDDLECLHRFNNDLENELIGLREKLEVTEKENFVMKRTIEQLESKCAESEVKLDALEMETVKLSNLEKEMECLRVVNGNLGLELDMLHEELDERRNIEENLASELQERENEFELWDAEATSFIFDLQISNTRDILFENKVHELAGVCESLEGETASKDVEIQEMKRKESIMESEIEGLRAQLRAYTPVIGSLKENIASLEHKFFNMANLIVSDNRKSEDVEVAVHPYHHQTDPELMGSPKSLEPNGIEDLIEFQTRITALEKVIVQDISKIVKRETSETDIKPRSAKLETEELKSPLRSSEDQKRTKAEKLRGKRYLTLDNLNLTKTKPEMAEVRKGVPIRDIPLDQASDGSSSANSRSRSRRGYLRTDDMIIEQLQMAHRIHETEKKSKKIPYEPQIEDFGVDKLEVVHRQEGTKGKLLERLASDAQKLANLETTVKDLKKRLETGKKSKKPNSVDFETVKEQLEEAEETILQLVNVNVESTASIEKNPSLSAWVEQEDAWKGSERIKRVQLEVQKIQYVLLKLDDEKKIKGKSRFSRTKSRTTVILRDFIHHGKSGRSSNSSSGRRRRLCGCFTPSATKGDRIRM